MGHYSEEEDRVRVDFFKPSGKWHCTEAMKWTGGYDEKMLILVAFSISLRDHVTIREFATPDRNIRAIRYSDNIAVCLEPFHIHSHPLMLPVMDAITIAEKGLKEFERTRAHKSHFSIFSP